MNPTAEGHQPVNHASDDISSDLSKFLGHLDQPDSQGSKQSLLLGVSERTALLLEHRASIVSEPQTYIMGKSRTLMARLTSPLKRMFPDDEPEDAMSTSSIVCTEIYILVSTFTPTLLTYAQEHTVHVAPTFSLGHLDTASLAASTIANTVISVTGFTPIHGFTSALDSVIISSGQMGNVLCLRTAVLVAMTLLPILHMWSYAEYVLLSLGQDSEVATLVSLFLNIAAVGIPAFACNEIFKRYLAQNDLSAVQARVAALSAPLSVTLNYLLVNGPPAFRLGFAGAPASSVICHYSTTILTALCILPTFFACKRADESRKSSKQAYFAGMGLFLSTSISGIGRMASVEWSKHFSGLPACLLGQKALAAQAALLVTVSCFGQAPRAVQTASTARIKLLLSRGYLRKAKAAALVSLTATLAIALAFSNLVLSFGPSWGKLFTSDLMVIDVITSAMPFIALYQAIDGISSWTDGALISLGRSATFPVLKASSDCSIGIPLGIYLAFVRKWNLAGLWGGLVASSAYSLLLGLPLLVKSVWSYVPDSHVVLNSGDGQPV